MILNLMRLISLIGTIIDVLRRHLEKNEKQKGDLRPLAF
jgi:hypothetical protein